MTFVGPGGSYVAEATYRWVGEGAGQFSYVKPNASRGYCWLGLLGFVLLAMLGLLAWIFVDNNMRTTTVDPEIAPEVGPDIILPENIDSKKCVIWGDPHIIGWDGAQSNWYDEGDFWIASNNMLSIQ